MDDHITNELAKLSINCTINTSYSILLNNLEIAKTKIHSNNYFNKLVIDIHYIKYYINKINTDKLKFHSYELQLLDIIQFYKNVILDNDIINETNLVVDTTELDNLLFFNY